MKRFLMIFVGIISVSSIIYTFLIKGKKNHLDMDDELFI